MSAPQPRPAGKSTTPTPDHPRTAQPATPPAAVGERTAVARQGVVSALQRPKPFPDTATRGSSEDPTPDRPGIRIYVPPVYRHHKDGARWSKRHGDTPNAAYACACGQTRTATGAHAVAALAADYGAHKDACTGTPAPLIEGRTAA